MAKYIGETALRQLWTNVENKIESEISMNSGNNINTNILDYSFSYSEGTAHRTDYNYYTNEYEEIEESVKKGLPEIYLKSENIPSEYLSYFEDDYGNITTPIKLITNYNFYGNADDPVTDHIAFFNSKSDAWEVGEEFFTNPGIYVNPSYDNNQWTKALTAEDFSYHSGTGLLEYNQAWDSFRSSYVTLLTDTYLSYSFNISENTISNINTSLSTLLYSISDLFSAISDLNYGISNLESSVSDLNYGISNLESSVSSDLNRFVDDLNSSISSLSSNVANLSSSLENAISRISNLEEYINSNG